MISRRNIRVKVMQTLYTLAALDNGEVFKDTASKILTDKLSHTLDLFTVSVLYTLRVAQYAETDAAKRASKYLPSQEDLNVDTQITTNEFVSHTLTNTSFNERVKNSKLDRFISDEWVKKAYQQLTKTPEYATYIGTNQRDAKKEKEIINYTWEHHILGNEEVQEHFDDVLPGWEDNKDMIVMLMQNFFKGGAKISFSTLLSTEKREYAFELLETVIDKEEYCMSLIEPKLKNWDTERVALIDLLLLRMGVCELLYFPTIPTKVTINEYIEIAKQYSTPQSGQFVNGVLDNILKDLTKENKIEKQERTGK